MFENYFQKKKHVFFRKFSKIFFFEILFEILKMWFFQCVFWKMKNLKNFENRFFENRFCFSKNFIFLKKVSDFFWQIIFEHNFLHHKIIFFVLVFFPDKVWVCIFSFWHLHTPTTSLELRTMGIDLARIVASFTQLKKNRCYIYIYITVFFNSQYYLMISFRIEIWTIFEISRNFQKNWFSHILFKKFQKPIFFKKIENMKFWKIIFLGISRILKIFSIRNGSIGN